MKRTKRSRRVVALLRAVGVFGAVGIIVGGVTFAALQSQNVQLASNSIESATAQILVSSDGTNYGDISQGFDFANVEPGGSPVPTNGNTFYLRNVGSTTMNLRLGIDGSALSRSGTIDLTKVFIVITPQGGGAAQSIPISALTLAYAGGGGTALNLSLPANTVGQYRLQVSMSADAVSGPPTNSVGIGHINMYFSGTTATT